MKSFRPISIVPIPTDSTDSPEIAELKREFNEKLREVGLKANDAIKSLGDNLLEMGLWSSGTIVTFHGGDAATSTQDLAVRHGLGTVPQYWLPLRQKWHGAAQDGNAGPNNLIEGVTAWTDKYVYFRIGAVCYTGTGDPTFKVLLIP